MEQIIKDKPVIIKVESSFDPNSEMTCDDHGLTQQRRIDYLLRTNNIDFIVPLVWAAVCNECRFTTFAPKVGDAIYDKVFRHSYPLQAAIEDLMNTGVEV